MKCQKIVVYQMKESIKAPLFDLGINYKYFTVLNG